MFNLQLSYIVLYFATLEQFATNALLRLRIIIVIKQLLDEVEHDIRNYQSRRLCYLPKPKAEADNTDTRV